MGFQNATCGKQGIIVWENIWFLDIKEYVIIEQNHRISQAVRDL